MAHGRDHRFGEPKFACCGRYPDEVGDGREEAQINCVAAPSSAVRPTAVLTVGIDCDGLAAGLSDSLNDRPGGICLR